MHLTINGESFDLNDSVTVATLLEQLELDVAKVAVERNMEIVPCSQFASTMLEAEDKLEIIHFIGGG